MTDTTLLTAALAILVVIQIILGCMQIISMWLTRPGMINGMSGILGLAIYSFLCNYLF